MLSNRFLCLMGFFSLPAFVVFGSTSAPAAAEEVAVIVNRQNAENQMSFKEITDIFKQQRKFWGDNSKIYLVMRTSGSVEKEIILRRIYNMDEQEMKKYWLSRIFRGESTSFPKTFSSDRAIKRFISLVPNAIGFVNASQADDSIQVVTIDSKRPGDSGYSLSS